MKNKLIGSILKLFYKRHAPLWAFETLARIAAVILLLALCALPVAIGMPTNVQASSWWLAGGISPSHVVAAYQPIYAANLAASYINLANPGTHDAVPGTAPTWDVANGWIFASASSQYLITGIAPENNYSAIVRFSNVTASDNNTLFGSINSGTLERFFILPVYGNNTLIRWGYGAGVNETPSQNSGVLAITSDGGYRGGTFSTAIGSLTNSMPKFLIGCTSYDVFGGETPRPGYYLTGDIQAFAIYNTTLTSAQVLAVTNAMIAIDNWGTDTPTPTETFTPTNTFTPTPTETFTPTNTFTPTFTFTPTDTATFTPSSTFTETFTPTFTWTPTNTRTPIPAAVLTATYDAAFAYYSGIAANNYPTVIIMSILCGILILGFLTWGVIAYMKKH